MPSLHHIGFVVKNTELFAGDMFLPAPIQSVEDPVQNAKLSLFQNNSDTLVELVEPLNEDSFTWNFLQKSGEGFHHVCYETSMDELIKYSVEKKLVKLLGPVPAVLFDNRDVLFYLNRNRMIVEFLIK